MRTIIEARLEAAEHGIQGELSARHALLRVPEEVTNFWTPCLEVTLEEIDDLENAITPPRSRLWGTFSPRPEIWTGFVFTIGTLAVVGLFSTIYGFAQIMLSRPPVALWVPFCATVLALLLYTSALVGQGLSIAEMYRLRAFVDDCIREAEAESPVRDIENA